MLWPGFSEATEEGFSGADLAELCQRAAKAAVRDAIAADELRAGDDDAMDTTMGSEAWNSLTNQLTN